MQGVDFHQGGVPAQADWIWLICGTGDGPPLAKKLVARGWHVLVSVVNAVAARAYEPHPLLAIEIGPLADDRAVDQLLDRVQPRWVLDGTHPFATEISERLQRVCRRRPTPLLRLQRPPAISPSNGHPISRIQRLQELAELPLSQERLLLAIGSRHLAAALQASSAGAHFARILDRPLSLQQALASGIAPNHLACVRPGQLADGALEQALCRRWRISAVLCRQSGGPSEQLWRTVAAAQQLHLILIEPPNGDAEGALPLQELLDKLGAPRASHA